MDGGARVRRREFLALAGTALALVAHAHAARAQTAQPVPVIGFLSTRGLADSEYLVAAFRQALSEAGYTEGLTVATEFRWAEGHYERLPALAAELVARHVSVILAVGGEPAALATKAATATIPIVFGIGGDPVKLGLVESFARPGGNATGVVLLTTELETKRLGLLRELVPNPDLISVLLNPKFPPAAAQARELADAAQALGQRIEVLNATDERELDASLAALTRVRPAALLVSSDPFFDTRRERIIATAARLRIPAIYQFREAVVDGGLMSYGINLVETYRQFGDYVGRILKGAKPAELPVLQSRSFELVINLKTAKAMGLTIPPALLARADEVIE